MGNGPIALCKMCLSVQELQDSHLLPASVYRKLHSKHLRDPDNPNPDPISVSGRRARQTSKQTSDHLLCSDCEGILDRMGEKYVLPILANDLGFPFQDVLHTVAPDFAEPDLTAYACARNPSLACDKIAHFASGIFWKASVHAWVHVDSTVKIELRAYKSSESEPANMDSDSQEWHRWAVWQVVDSGTSEPKEASNQRFEERKHLGRQIREGRKTLTTTL